MNKINAPPHPVPPTPAQFLSPSQQEQPLVTRACHPGSQTSVGSICLSEMHRGMQLVGCASVLMTTRQRNNVALVWCPGMDCALREHPIVDCKDRMIYKDHNFVNSWWWRPWRLWEEWWERVWKELQINSWLGYSHWLESRVQLLSFPDTSHACLHHTRTKLFSGGGRRERTLMQTFAIIMAGI